MKKLLIILFLFCFCKIGFGQYPITATPIGNANTLSGANGGFRASLINKIFSDTTAANATPLDFYEGAQIYTTGGLMWYRTSNKWIQIITTGGSSDTLAWKLGGNDISAIAGFGIIGSTSNDPIYFITNNLKQLGIPETGILRSSSAFNKCLTFDTATKLMYYGDCSGGGGGGGLGRIGLIDSLPKSTNGASISGNSLFMQTATQSVPGLLSAADKAKIDSLNNIYWYAIQKSGYLSTAYRPNDSTIYAKALQLSLPAEFTTTLTTTDTTGTWAVTWSGAAGGGPYWGLTGNSGTDTATNFIGTTSNMPLRFKVNSVFSGELSTANTSFGYNALKAITSGADNVAIGRNALSITTDGYSNVGIGREALVLNTSGANNVAIGYGTLRNNTTAGNNIAIGGIALGNNTTGNENIAIGYTALSNSSTAYYNTGIGHYALSSNVSGRYLTAVGYRSMENNTADYNTAVGYYSLKSNTTGTINAAFGYNALQANTTGNYNTAIGTAAMETNTTGEHNTAVGWDALLNNSTGSGNIGVGWNAMQGNRTGINNVAMGYGAGSTVTLGNYNVFLGREAGWDASFQNDTVNGSIGIGWKTYTTKDSQSVFGAAYIKEFILNATDSIMLRGMRRSTSSSWVAAVDSATKNITYIPVSSISGGGSGTVTSVATGYGLSGGTITTTGTIIADSATLSTYYKRQKDSATSTNATGYLTKTSGWNILGNEGTTAGTNFLGTTDGVNLMFKANNLQSGLIGITGATAFGYQAAINDTRTNNASFGYLAFTTNTTGQFNASFGREALTANTTASNNTAFGYKALAATSTGGSNTAVGREALAANTTAIKNTAVGVQSLLLNTTGGNNTAIGYQSLDKNSTASENTAIGITSLFNNTTGYQNTAIGSNALVGNSIGYNNTAVGYNSGGADGTNVFTNTSRDTNSTFIGALATRHPSIDSATVLSNATAIGWHAQARGNNVLILGDSASITKTGIGTTLPDSLLTVQLGIWGKRGVRFSGLAAQANATDSMMVVNASNGNVGYRAIPSSGASGLTVGTTTIASGTTTRILYDNAGVLGEYTLTGTGTVVAMQTSPTFVTSIIAPLHIGSASADGTLTLQGNNAGAGNTSTVANIILKTGNTPTQWLDILNNGMIRVGSSPNQTTNTWGMTVDQPSDAQSYTGLALYANNHTAKMELGYQTIRTTGAMVIAPQSVGLEVNSKMYIGAATSPTAYLHLIAGTTTAATAPLKFTSGTNMTAAEAGAMEWDGTNLFITQTSGPTRKTLAYTTDITFPGAGIANSTGSAWGTSYTTTGSGTVLALATSPTLVTPLLGTPTSGVLTNTTGYKLDKLAAAGATNTINNADFQQELQWNSLTSSSGLKISTTSTGQTGYLLDVRATGVNSGSGVNTFGGYFENTHSGTGSINVGGLFKANSASENYAIQAESTGGLPLNIAGYFNANGGTTNYAAKFVRGKTSFGTAGTESGILEINGSTSGTAILTVAAAAGTPTITLPTATGTLATLAGTETFTNKRITSRTGSTTSSATPTINTDNVDIYKLTAQAADITSFTTNLSGTPNDGDMLTIEITGTASRAITWGSSFVSTSVTLPTTTSSTNTLTVILRYSTTSSYGTNKWGCASYF